MEKLVNFSFPKILVPIQSFPGVVQFAVIEKSNACKGINHRKLI